MTDADNVMNPQQRPIHAILHEEDCVKKLFVRNRNPADIWIRINPEIWIRIPDHFWLRFWPWWRFALSEHTQSSSSSHSSCPGNCRLSVKHRHITVAPTSLEQHKTYSYDDRPTGKRCLLSRWLLGRTFLQYHHGSQHSKYTIMHVIFTKKVQVVIAPDSRYGMGRPPSRSKTMWGSVPRDLRYLT